MNITCSSTDLLNALQTVVKAVAVKTDTPVLAGIFIKAEDGKIDLEATNNEISLKCVIEGQVDEPGEILVNGRYLCDMTRRLPTETVNISTTTNKSAFNEDGFSDANTPHSGNVVTIKSGKVKFNLLKLNDSDFPRVKPLDGNIKFSLRNNIFNELISKTAFACADKAEAHPLFTGCYMEINESLITMAATNTHRLALKKTIVDNKADFIKLIIPAKVLTELGHIIESAIPTDVAVVCTHNQISFAYDNIFMIARLIEGSFPAYQRVIPASFATVARVKHKELADAVDRIGLLSRNGEYKTILLSFNNNRLTISSTNPEIGDGDEDLMAEITGPDVNIAFNVNYIADCLKATDGEECIIKMNGSLDPAGFYDPQDEDFTYILTPVRSHY